MPKYNTNRYTTKDKDGFLRKFDNGSDAIETFEEREGEEPAYILTAHEAKHLLDKGWDHGYIAGLLVTGAAGILSGLGIAIIDYFTSRRK